MTPCRWCARQCPPLRWAARPAWAPFCCRQAPRVGACAAQRHHSHSPTPGGCGQASDIQIQAEEILRLRRRINDILAEHTGQPLDRIERDTDRDHFMTAEDAVAYGLVDDVIRKPKGDDEAAS